MEGKLYGTGRILIPHKINAESFMIGVSAFTIIIAKSVIIKIHIIKLQRLAYTQKLV